MIQMPLLQSKLTIPETPPNFYLSDRILNLYERMRNRRAVVVSAPAGYGKTTLLSTFLAASKANQTKVSWYNIDQGDQPPDVFLAYLAETLLASGADSETHQSLNKCILDDLNINHILSILCQEIWTYYHKHPGTFRYIVLDDFHHVSHIPLIRRAIIYLLYNLPPNCFIFLSSRYEINVFSEKQKLDKGIIEINLSDLCFAAKEICHFFSDNPDMNEDNELIEKVALITEGWAAGIVILHKALKGSSIKAFSNKIENFAYQSPVFDYFNSEIFPTIDSDLLSFLLKISLLSEFTSEDAQIFMPKPDSAAQMLEYCIARGLFLQKTYTGEAIYHFHFLFKKALSGMLPEYFSADEKKALHLKAAYYFLEKKAYGQGIEHLLNCQDISIVYQFFLKESINMDIFQDTEQLQLLFDLIPEDMVADSKVLLFVKALTYMHINYEESCQVLNLAFEKSRQDGNFLIMLNMALALVYAYYCTNDMKAIKKLLSQVQKPELPYPNPSVEAAVTLLEIIKAVFADRLKNADSLCAQINQSALEQHLKLPFHIISCILYFRLGKHDIAINAIQEALNLEAIKKAPTLTGLAYVSYSFPLLLKKDIGSLSSVVAELLSTGEKHGFHYLLGNGQLIQAYINYIGKNPDRALESLDNSIACFREMKNPAMSEFCKLLKYLWSSQYTESWELLAEAENSLETIRKHKAGYELYEIGQSILGVLNRNHGNYHEAEYNFRAAINASEKKGARQVACGACIHLAKLYFDRGDHCQGIKSLHMAFNQAASYSYYMFWDIQYPTVLEMAARAVKLGLNTDYALRLVEEHFGIKGRQLFNSRLDSLSTCNLEDFSRDFVSSAYFEANNPMPRIKVRFLGNFAIQVNQYFLPEEIWKTKKIKGLFIYLLLNKGKPMSREHLTDLFWPDSDKKYAAMSFRAALYELKRILAQYGMLSRDSNNFLRETASGLEICISERLNTDLDEFYNLNKRRNTLSAYADRTDYLINTLEKMLSIYQGDLLENESYDDWIFIEREKLKSIFIDSTLQLSREYVKKGDYQRAENPLFKILARDPYHEPAAYLLLELYINTNQKSRALQFFTGFKERLESDLGVKIDLGLSSAIQAIMISESDDK